MGNGSRCAEFKICKARRVCASNGSSTLTLNIDGSGQPE